MGKGGGEFIILGFLILIIFIYIILYIISGVLLIISSASRIDASKKIRNNALRLATGISLAYFVISLILLIISVVNNTERFFFSQYSYLVLYQNFFNKLFPQIAFLNISVQERIYSYAISKILEIVFFWPVMLIFFFILNAVLFPVIFRNKETAIKKNIFKRSVFFTSSVILIAVVFFHTIINILFVRTRILDPYNKIQIMGPAKSLDYKEIILYDRLDKGKNAVEIDKLHQIRNINSGFFSGAVDKNSEIYYYNYPNFYKNVSGIDEDKMLIFVLGEKVGYDPDMIFDKNQNLHMAYLVYDTDLIKYAVNKDGNWTIETVDKSILKWITLSLDNNNNPYIVAYAYKKNNKYIGFDFDLICYFKKDGIWEKDIIVNEIRIDYDELDKYSRLIDVKIDSGNIIHLSYIVTSDRSCFVYYAKKENGAWLTNKIGSFVTPCTSLAVDKKSKVHLTYTDRQNNVFYYNNSSGVFKTIHLPGIRAFTSVIVLRNGITPVIFYDDNEKGGLGIWSESFIIP